MATHFHYIVLCVYMILEKYYVWFWFYYPLVYKLVHYAFVVGYAVSVDNVGIVKGFKQITFVALFIDLVHSTKRDYCWNTTIYILHFWPNSFWTLLHTSFAFFINVIYKNMFSLRSSGCPQAKNYFQLPQWKF